MTETNRTVERLVAIGGNRWQRDDMDRVYFDLPALTALYGLQVTLYGTGNISSATLNGEAISNSKARKILAILSGTFWYDVAAEEFRSREIGPNTVQTLTTLIRARIA